MPIRREIYKSIKDIPRQEYLAGGTGLCAGCGGLLALRLFHKALGPNVVFVNAAGLPDSTGGLSLHPVPLVLALHGHGFGTGWRPGRP